MATILHIMQCTNLGGMEQVAYRLMDNLSISGGVGFRVATPRPFGPGKQQVRRFDPEARDFPYRGRFGWRDFPAFRRHIHRLADECSHIWVTGTSAAALAAVLDLRKPKVLSHHYPHFVGAHPQLRWRVFYELLCRQVDAVTYPTQFTRNEALHIAPWLKDKACVSPNGYKVIYSDEQTRLQRRAAARRKLNLPQDALVVGNAGWLVANKRFDVFLRTAARILAVRPDAVFMICGGGSLEGDLKRLASQLGIIKAVRFEGWVQDLGPYYDAWDAMLFNSDFEALGGSVLEAAGHGCVTVASAIYGGLGEFLVSGQTGYLCDRHDEAALAEMLLCVADRPAQTLALRQNAIARLKADFSDERAAAFYRSFFQ